MLALAIMPLAGLTFSVESRTLSPFLAGGSAPDPSIKSASHSPRQGEKYFPLIIKLADAGAALPSSVTELHRRGRMVLAYVPQSALQEVAALGVVSRIEGGQVCVPALDEARQFTGLPEVISGREGLSYTGKGVVVGFADTGFDPNHIAFKDEKSGLSRIARLTNYGESPSEVTRLETPEEIAGWSTDDPDQWHATHVGGILAGGYKGNPYWGIATGAEIVATTSLLYDALLLAGMEDVVEYAREVGKPAVINMSVSASLGPHDGTSLFCQYLEQLSDEATICISAGNDGGRVGIWTGVFPEDGPTAAAVVDVPSWRLFRAEGYIDVWSKDASSFDFAILVVDTQTNRVVMREAFPTVSAAGVEQSFVIASSVEELPSQSYDEAHTDISGNFASCFNGFVSLTTEVNPENGRFNGLVHVDVENLPGADGEVSERYEIALEVTGRKGQRMTAYASDLLRFREVDGYAPWMYLGTDGVINDFVTGEGVIGVGAMCSRNTWPLLDGEEGTGSYAVGDIAGFSSCSTGGIYGKLPDIVAPGAWLISSYSTPYLLAHPDRIPYCCQETTDEGKDYYWGYASGTSMASPYVAGVCALWLEANPDATPAEIKEAIVSTATPPTVNPSNPRWGKGMLDSYAGLRKILSAGAIEPVRVLGNDDDFPPLPSPLTPESLAGYARDNDCKIFTPSGSLTDPSAVGHGVYILRCGGRAIKVAL